MVQLKGFNKFLGVLEDGGGDKGSFSYDASNFAAISDPSPCQQMSNFCGPPLPPCQHVSNI